MKIQGFVVIGLIAGLLAACDNPPVSAEDRKDAAATAMNKDMNGYLSYVKDHRTGICYAASLISNGFYVYSPVSCTDRVMKILINPEK